MTSFPARVAAVLAALTAVLFMSGCTKSSDDAHADHQQTTTATDAPAASNDADISFATNMIPHHQQAVELSALVPDRSTNPELVKLAADISAAQQPEIETMKVFLVQWRGGAPAETPAPRQHGPMAGMVDDATMAKLKSLKGSEFDKLWLQSMIGHHQGAVEMAQTEIVNGANVDAKRLAQSIIDTQRAEIDHMNTMLSAA